MNSLRATGLAVAWGVAALWTVRTVERLRGMRRVPDLLQRPAGAPLAKLSVIVPARNEAGTVAAGLRSLLNSRHVDLEVIAVNDRSTDGTVAVMNGILGEPRGERVRYLVEQVECLREGWLGKPNAMARGAERATGEWLLFTDADVVFAPDALSRALTFLEATNADHLVVLPTVVAGSAGEAMMLPFLHVISVWGPRLWRVPDARSPRDAVGVGAFNLIRRTAYDAVGGWGVLRMEVVEDLLMGYVLKRAGFISQVAVGRDLVRVRWAQGAWGVVANLTKNLFAVFRFRLLWMAGGAIGTAVICLTPVVAVALGLSGARAWLWPGLLSAASLFALYWQYHRASYPGAVVAVLWIAGFPLATLLFLYAMMYSTLLTLLRGGVVWRGTFYPLKQLRAHAVPLR